MSKYFKLTQYLASIDGTQWTATFNEVEDVLGFPLPPSARQYPAWWSNQGRSQSLAWESAGWHTTAVDVERQRLTFAYVADRENRNAGAAAPLTISEAKAGLSVTFGVPVEAIEIIIRA